MVNNKVGANHAQSHAGSQAPMVRAARSRKRGKQIGASESIPGSEETIVCIARQLGSQPLPLLEQVLDGAGFWQHIERRRQAAGRQRDQFRIIIKPDLDFYDPQVPAGTDPALVEHLIDLLHDRGYRQVAVGDGRNSADGWLYNREALVVPELVGYRFATAKGRSYDLVDLREPTESGATGQAALLPCSSHWSAADYRINFAKNKTHEEYGFALCLHNLAGVARAGCGGGMLCPADDCLEVLRRVPPDFNLIDGFISCHGGAGQRAPQPMETHTLIASADALLADWAGAAKMGLDPYASAVNSVALKRIGLPKQYEIAGDLTPYPLWRNVHPLLSHSARLRRQSDDLGRIAEPWLQTVDRECFPFKDFYNDRINSFVAPLMAQVDKNPRSLGMIVLFNYAVAKLGAAVQSQYTLFSKGKLRRRVAPLEADLAAYDLADYTAIPGYLRPYEEILEGMPANRSGLRWRLIDKSVLFSCSHTFPIPFEAFTRKVDIAQSIQYMNDYIGGSTVAIRRDRRKRVTHQAERNIYLQQPNWMVLFGGNVIDVEKLEFIDYRPDRQAIYWRTVNSPNGSGLYDDGSVTFQRSGAGQTTVRIFARQQFALPPFFQIFDVTLLPTIRDPIIENGYAAFFAGTVANLQARYEGRDFRIGQDSEATAAPNSERPDGGRLGGERLGDLARYLATAVSAAAELLRHREDVANFGTWLFPAAAAPASAPSPGFQKVDRDGFRHFAPSPGGSDYIEGRGDEQATIAGLAAIMRDAPDFVTGLVDAVRDDLNRMATATGNGAAP